MSYKIDLHTHSYASPDGGLALEAYKYFLDNKLLDYVAVTDHNDIATAKILQQKLGPQIIIGEEIMTHNGELIGLFLTEKIEPGLSLLATAKAIKSQGGLVYVPHPFETVRSGIAEHVLTKIAPFVDIVETANGRAYRQNYGRQAAQWAHRHGKATAASSDAHGRFGWGYTYSAVSQQPTKDSLVKALTDATFSIRRVGFVGVLYPTFNRLTKRLRKAKRA